MVNLNIYNTHVQMEGPISTEALSKLDAILSYDHPGYQFMNGGRGGFGLKGAIGGWDGKIRLLSNTKKFSIGLLDRVRDFLKEEGIEFSEIEKRPLVKYGKPLKLDTSKFELRDYQRAALTAAKKHESGVIRMATGCHKKGTKILMFDGLPKSVEDVVVGDKIMGPDSTPRVVLELCRGSDRMVKIIPTKGDPFIINQDHILTLKKTKRRDGDKNAGNIFDIKFSDWEKLNKYQKHISKLFRVGIELSEKKQELDPYFTGLMLGDGSLKRQIGITTTDDLIVNYIKEYTKRFSVKVRKSGISYFFSSQNNDRNNLLLNIMKSEGLYPLSCENKKIPDNYKLGSRRQRLELLAGLIDSDGSIHNNGFDFISKSKDLANDVVYVARSLGFASYISQQIKKCTNNGVEGLYYRVSINGHCDLIPTKLERKKAGKRLQKKDPLSVGFSFEEAGYDEYFGFKVDSDNRYLLGDFTVTHNSGKTLVIASLFAQYNIPTIIYVIGIELLYQMKETIESAYGVKCGIVGGGECDVNHDVIIMTIWSAAAAFDKEAKIDENDLTSESEVVLNADKKSLIRKKIESAKLFIFDECQYAASETLQFIHKVSVSARHRFLLSGTPWRDTGDDILIEAVGGRRIYDLNATTLIKKGFLIPPDIYMVNVPVVRNVGTNYQQVYTNYIVDNDVRNELIMNSARKLIAAGKKLLVLVVRVGHGKKILDMLSKEFRAKFLDGGKSTKNRLETIKDMKEGKLDVLVASKIFDQGVDIPELDALILAGSGKSSGRALQRIGRVIRLSKGKEKAVVVDFFDNCKYLKDHSESRIKIYESEPGFNIIKRKKEPLSYPERKAVDWT